MQIGRNPLRTSELTAQAFLFSRVFRALLGHSGALSYGTRPPKMATGLENFPDDTLDTATGKLYCIVNGMGMSGGVLYHAHVYIAEKRLKSYVDHVSVLICV